MNPMIVQAIKSRSVLSIYYKNEVESRLIEPFCYGINIFGKEFLRAYQAAGFSNHPNEVPNWRLFSVSEISKIEAREIHFDGIRQGYNPNDSIMSQIYCNI